MSSQSEEIRMEKKRVWVPDVKEGYLAGWVDREEEDVAEVVMDAGGEVYRFQSQPLSLS